MRVADIRKCIERSLFDMDSGKARLRCLRNLCLVHSDRVFEAVEIDQSETVCVAKRGKPRIVKHNQIVGTGVCVEVYQFFLEEIWRKGNSAILNVDAGLFLVVEGGLLERIAFDAGVYGKG